MKRTAVYFNVISRKEQKPKSDVPRENEKISEKTLDICAAVE